MATMTSGFSGRSLSFYGLPSSKVVSGAPSVEEAIKMAGLDWRVGLEPVYQTLRDGSVRIVKDKFLTVREDTEAVLGTVGKQYHPFQAEEAFAFADALLGYGVEFDAAGSYNDDRKFFLTAKLPEGINVQGQDPVDLYLLFRSTHDGSGAINAMITPVRLACTNMLNLATRTAVSKWSARHTRTASDRVSEAARTLQIVETYTAEFNKIAEQLLAVEMDLEAFTAFTQDVTTAERLQKGMVETWTNSPSVDRSTRWGALNAVGEHMEWMRGGRGNVESRFESNLDGQTAAIRNRAAQLLLRRG